MKSVFIGLALGLLLSFNAFAEDGSSGCGPGWYILKDNSLVSSSLRATTNGMLFPAVSFGMTFGTSNCTKHKIVKTEKQSLYFATNNYYELQGDIARGQGEHLSAFATTIGCPAQVQTRFNQHVRKNYSAIFTPGQTSPEALLLEVYKTILRDQTLTNQCSLGIG